jgi:hypothetical protein
VTRWIAPAACLLAISCSDLNDAGGGVVALEVTVPSPPIVEVNETLQLSARALNKDGDSVAASIVWSAGDPTITVDPSSGVLTGVSPGTGRVQASVGTLTSGLFTFSVIAPADTIIIAGDSVFTVAPDVPASAPLAVRVESFTPAGPVEARPVIYTLTSPDPATIPPTVAFPNGLSEDTAATGADGTVTALTLTRIAGLTAPDTAIVTVRATRTRGAVVPGSGQRFIVLFQ